MYGKCMGKLGVIVGPIHEVEEVNGHLQGPKPECKHLILRQFLGTGAFALEVRPPNH